MVPVRRDANGTAKRCAVGGAYDVARPVVPSQFRERETTLIDEDAVRGYREASRGGGPVVDDILGKCNWLTYQPQVSCIEGLREKAAPSNEEQIPWFAWLSRRRILDAGVGLHERNRLVGGEIGGVGAVVADS